MKRIFCTFLPLALLALLLTSSLTRADPPKPTLTKCVLTLDREIDCPSCEDGIKHVLMTAHGVQSADVDVLTNRITVRYDASRINVKALIGRISVMGYAASEAR